jgi:hypothetical protein
MSQLAVDSSAAYTVRLHVSMLLRRIL